MKKEDGSLLVSSMLILIVLTLSLGAVFTVVASSHKRSVNNAVRTQLHMTAKSGADLIADEIMNETDVGKAIYELWIYSGGEGEFVPSDVNKVKYSGPIPISFPEEMGICEVRVSEDGDELVVTATAQKSGYTAVVAKRIYINADEPIDPENPDFDRDYFEVVRYERGEQP